MFPHHQLFVACLVAHALAFGGCAGLPPGVEHPSTLPTPDEPPHVRPLFHDVIEGLDRVPRTMPDTAVVPEAGDPAELHYVATINSGGPAPWAGSQRATLRFAEILDGAGRPRVTLWVVMGTRDRRVAVSAIAWSGNPVPGTSITGSMLDRETTGCGADAIERVAAKVTVSVSTSPRTTSIYVAYNANGVPVALFGHAIDAFADEAGMGRGK